MGYITIPEFSSSPASFLIKEGEEFPDPLSTFKAKVIEVPDIRVEWVPPQVSPSGFYRVSIAYKHRMNAFSFTPEAIPIKVAGIQPFINNIADTLQKMAYIDEEAMPWFRQDLLAKCFPGNKPARWPDHEEKPDFQEMANELPGLNQKVGCPKCGKRRKKTTLGDVIIHLNDQHMVTREYIASWLEEEAKKGLDITFKTPEEKEQEDERSSRTEDSGSKAAAHYEFLKSGHLTKEQFDDIFSKWKDSHSPLGVWDGTTE